MPNHAADPKQWIGYVITAVIVAFVLALRMRRLSRPRPLKLERLWIFPTLYLVLASVMLFEFPPSGWQWALCGVALVVGAALGWQRGRMMHIEVNSETHALNQRASAGALLLIIALVAVRVGARGLAGEGGMLHLNTLVLTDVLIVMALGLFTAQRVEMYLRGRLLLDTARQARA